MRPSLVHRVSRTFTLITCAVLVVACGGDGGGGNYDSVLGAAFEGKEADLGLFEPWRSLRNICENPRPGDGRGSTTDEKRFLRSFSNDTYLWYDEIEPVDPTDSRHTVAQYFDLMKTTATTSSGNPKDQFHFTWNTEAWREYSRSGATAGYGMHFSNVGGELVVRYAEPDSAAGRNDISRGARIVSVEGRSYAQAESLSDFLYPSGDVRNYTFEVRDLDSTTTRTFTMRAGPVSIDPVRHTRVIDTDAGRVGYLFFTNHNFPSEQELIEAFQELSEAAVTDLVLDIRYNGGGLLGVANELAFMIAGPAAASGRVFDRLRFNDKYPSVDPIAGQPIDPGLFVTTAIGYSAAPGIALPSLNLNRVFVLSTDRTCSASESVINGLRGVDVEVILIGGTTCGKPYGFYPQDNCGTTYFTIQFSASNHKRFGDYPDGFSPQNTTGAVGVSLPGCAVADDLNHALGDPDEAQLAAALQYRTDGSCPTPPRGFATRPVAVGDDVRTIGFMTVE